jgi:hypothetical protein
VDSIGAEEIAIVDLHRLGEVIDLKSVGASNGPCEDAVHSPFIKRVVACETIPAVVTKAIKPAVPDVHDMSLTSPQDQSRQGARHPLEIGIGAANGVHPAIHGFESTGTFLLHCEQLTLTQIAIDETPYHGFGRHAATFCPANAIGDSCDHTMAGTQRWRAFEKGAIVLVVQARTPFRGIASSHPELF